MLIREQSTLLTDGAKHLNIALTQEHIAQFAIYLEELNSWARIVDLISQSDPRIIVRKHILDSLAALAMLPQQGRLLDLGSGAGFPGLPIAIVNPSLAVTLLEPRRKRVNFLKEVIRKTRLTNATAVEGRAEEFAKTRGWNSAFDAAITRATWNIREFLFLARPFLADQGVAIAMKGEKAEEELKSLENWLEKSGCVLKRQFNYDLPFGEEKRCFLIFSFEVNVSRDT